MELSPLTAISPLDGRYGAQAAELRPWFSELALIRARVRIEAAWLARLAAEPGVGPDPEADALACLEAAADGFSEADALAVKAIERTTNHDVKAVEYFLRERLAPWPRVAEFTHFACTSEDVNNLAWATLVQGGAGRGAPPRDRRAHRIAPDPRPRLRGRSDARPHPRPARLADDHGQGARERGRAPRPAARADRRLSPSSPR